MGMGDVPGGVTVGPAPQVIPSVPRLQETLAEAKPVPVASMMVVGPLSGRRQIRRCKRRGRLWSLQWDR